MMGGASGRRAPSGADPTFHVVLPMAVSANPVDAPILPDAWRLEGRRLLIVDETQPTAESSACRPRTGAWRRTHAQRDGMH